MSTVSDRLPRPIRSVVTLPADLAALLVSTAALDALTTVFYDASVAVVLSVPLLLFVPGYAVVSALFPGRSAPDDAADAPAGIDLVERVALSFGLSLGALPVVGLVLATGPWGIRPWSVAGAYSLVVVAGVAVAVVRRRRLPRADRFVLPYRDWANRAEVSVRAAPRRETLANVALAVAVVSALATVGLGLAAPQARGGYDSLALLTETPDGSLVAADYPDELAVGETRTLVVEVGNRRAEAVQYTVVVQLQRVDADGTVTRRAELDRFGASVGADETWRRSHDVSPSFAGEDLRLAYLLYAGDPPADPTMTNADQETHLWLTVGR